MLLSAAFAILFLYGLYSTPGLVGRWGVSASGAMLFAVWGLLAGAAWPISTNRLKVATAISCVVAAIALRLFVAWPTFGHIHVGDALYYPQMAQGLLNGAGLSVYEPFIGSMLRALYPPAYPLLLAGWGSVWGFSIGSILLLNIVIDGLACWQLCELGKRLDRPAAGRAAAWLYAIWPSTLFSASVAQKEGLCVLLILTLANYWLRTSEDDRWRWSLVLPIGIVSALLALTQPAMAPIPLLFGLAMMPYAGVRRIMAVGTAAVVVAGLCMTPWWIRNWLVLHAFVPLTSSSEISLWIGNNPDATGNWIPTPPNRDGLGELEYAKSLGALARQWIAAHPGEFVYLTAAKFVRAMSLGEFGLIRMSALKPTLPPATFSALLPLAQGAHLALLAAAAFVLGRSQRIPGMLISLIVAGGLQLLLFGVWFEFGERHREFLTPFLLLTLCIAVAARKPRPVDHHAR